MCRSGASVFDQAGSSLSRSLYEVPEPASQRYRGPWLKEGAEEMAADAIDIPLSMTAPVFLPTQP